MASTREIRRRIRSVRNIAQVTRALEAISASRVRRAQQAVLATRPYAAKAWEVLQRLSRQPVKGASLHPLLDVRPEIKAIDVVLITSDHGLAGPFISNLVRAAMQLAAEQTAPLRWITVGRKGRDLMYRRRQNIVAEFHDLPATPGVLDISPIARSAIDDFLKGACDEVVLAYTDFVNTLVQRPVFKRLLPLLPGELAAHAAAEHVGPSQPSGPTMEVLYEPSAEAILNVVLPRFTQLQVYQAVLESLASEHSARMVAMRNATDNAEELVGTLQLIYNKARQLAITSDLLDIAGGAEALAQALASQ